jgi:CheY-like chemotaxis protein
MAANLSHLSRVLVVEDEALILMDVAGTLEEARVAEVVSAISADEAMAALDRRPFDAAVLDLHLGRDGPSYDIARRLRTLKIPFVFSSGSTESMGDFRDVPLLTKPFSADQLLAALLQVTAGRDILAAE